MSSYTLDLRAIGQFFANQPTLEIWNDGFLETSSLISSSGEDISLNLSYNGNLPSSLEFCFNDGLGETGRLISLKSIKINDRHVNIGNFLSLEVLDQYITASVDISAASALFDTSEPDASSFQPSDGNFTTGNDSYRNLNNINHIIDAQDGRDTVYLGGGVDRVFGNDGNDIIYAGGADDLVSGGNGDDRLYGQDGNDIIYGGGRRGSTLWTRRK